LLERRGSPRIGELLGSGWRALAWPGELRLSGSREPRFWRANCKLTVLGRAVQLLYRIPEVRLTVYQAGAKPRRARVIPGVLSAPVLENPPVTLEEFAAVFRGKPLPAVERLTFDGAGASYFACQAELLSAVKPRPE